jgi:hypothetical protein
MTNALLSEISELTSGLNVGLQFDRWVNDLLPGLPPPEIPDQVADPCGAAEYLHTLRDITILASKVRPLIRITDSNLDVMSELEGEMSCSVEELMDDTGHLKIVIRYDNWLVDWMTHQTTMIEDLNIIVDPNPAEQDWRTRWGGKITEIHVKRDEKGIHEIELTAMSFREHAKKLLAAANPIFPPEIQLPKMWVLPGPTRTICAVTAFVNLGRLFMPGWSAITNIFNPAGWINPLNPDAALNILPTAWPIQVAFVDPVLDQSRWSAIGARWTDWHSTFKDILTDAGCIMRAYTYLTTDKDSPNTELTSILELVPDLVELVTGQNLNDIEGDIGKLVAPIRNCVVFAFEQVDGVHGPTGTAFDGLLDTVAVTLDDLITPIAIDITTGDTFDPGEMLNGEPVWDAAGISRTHLIEQLTGLAPEVPKVIWWDNTYSGMISTDLTWHKGGVKTIMTGSKSPTIVNQAQTFAIRYGLSRLSDVINEYLAVWAGGESQVQGTNGLDNLYQGQLDDTLLAWERYTDPIRALYGGDVAWQEHFEKGSGTAYTLASIITLRDGDWKTRPFAAFKATTENGRPWIADVDYFLGDRVGFEQEGIIYVDNVYGIKREWDWATPLKVTMKIGEDKQKSDPFGAAFKTMAAIYTVVGQVLGEGTLFG